MIGGEIDDFLRRARAFERQRRLGEHCAAAGLEFLQALPSVGDMGGRIVAAYAVLAQRLGEPGDLAPVELHAGADHEIVVGHGIAVVEIDRVLVRLEGLRGVANPADADGNQASFGRRVRARSIGPGADQRKGRLIVVVGRRFDDGDVACRRPRRFKIAATVMPAVPPPMMRT